MTKGRLYLIPSPIGDCEPSEVIPAPVLELMQDICVYVVEDVRTARRYLSRAGLKGHIDELEFHELNEHSTQADVESLMHIFDGGRDAGLISEAGLPAVADPGAQLAALCHGSGIDVIPMTGPSSIMLALMASGLNGQSFAFLGYLPVKPEERRAALRRAERSSAANGQTQIFIETPYRNDAMLADILQTCRGGTRVCIAADITMPDMFIRTKTVDEWKSCRPAIGKRPCVFLLLS